MQDAKKYTDGFSFPKHRYDEKNSATMIRPKLEYAK